MPDGDECCEEREWWGFRKLRGSGKQTLWNKEALSRGCQKWAWCVWAATRTRVAGAEWVRGGEWKGMRQRGQGGRSWGAFAGLHKNPNLRGARGTRWTWVWVNSRLLGSGISRGSGRQRPRGSHGDRLATGGTWWPAATSAGIHLPAALDQGQTLPLAAGLWPVSLTCVQRE